MTDVLQAGRRTLMMESEALREAANRLDARFVSAVELLAAGGRVIVSGIGKSWLIAQKIAATMTSTGTPALSLHPVESLHGDLGLVDPDAVAIILSNSGETEELSGLLAALARMAVPIIAITGNAESTLARTARVVLDASVKEEACPHNLAPTTSTTVALAIGDALAVALLEWKGFKADDFAQLHPGGRLGRKLLLRVRDVMTPTERMLPPASTMREVVVALAHGRGLAVIVEGNRLAGVITAGDLTRLAERSSEYLALHADAVMTRSPRVARLDDLAATAVGQMERHAIMALPVIDAEGQVQGTVHLHDLLRAGAA